MTTLYTRPNCPACNIIKRELDKRGVIYETQELTDETIQKYETVNQVRPKSAPILQHNDSMVSGLLPSRDLVRNL